MYCGVCRFSDHESYETIIKTLTRGDPEKAQHQFSIELYRIADNGHQPDKVKDNSVDVKEQFWVHTYNNLVDFITDFQMNRSGKPTKAMQAQINDWNPTLDLQRATKEDRLKWRRSYTINWLYDLVNVFSSIVVQRNTMKGEKHRYEYVDWSPTGPWHHHRRLWGLNEFAGFITKLAMQKPNTDIRHQILPHHVFQLQCIVDSLTASRGWMLSPFRGHVLGPPARSFRPRRDVDLFLDRQNERQGQGLLQAIDILKQLLEKDAELHHDPRRHRDQCEILEEIKWDYVNWLGESKYMYGLDTIPPSRFSKSNANGLWEYSPLLCASGLVEGLVLAQRVAFLLWDRIPEPTLAFHLHNMLVKRGYIQRPIGLYSTLENLLEDSIFPEGVPESNFFEALLSRTQLSNYRATIRQRSAAARNSGTDIHKLMDIGLNPFFKTKSALVMYSDVDWVPEKIPDGEIRIPSLLYMVRLSETKRVVDSLTGEKRLEETTLVQRSKARGRNDAELLEMAAMPSPLSATSQAEETESLLHRIHDFKDQKPAPPLQPYRVKDKKKQESITGRSLLDLLRLDFFADVCGRDPLSSLNYVWITVHIFMLFMRIEDRLREARHPLYLRAYENPMPQMRLQKRLALITNAMAEEDVEALKMFAEVFQDPRVGAINCIFWKDLQETDSGNKPRRESDDIPMDDCSVM